MDTHTKDILFAVGPPIMADGGGVVGDHKWLFDYVRGSLTQAR